MRRLKARRIARTGEIMGTSVKVIKFTSVASAILVLFTYAVSLAAAYEWFDMPWLSNSFLLTIFGGALASMLVVLICEIQKYVLIKREMENQIFIHAGAVCGKLLIMQLEVKKRLNNQTDIIDDYYTRGIPDIQNEISILKNIDFAPYSKNNALKKTTDKMISWLTQEVFFVLNEGQMLKVAINNDRIQHLETYKCEGIITSQSPYTNRFLTVFDTKLESVVKKMDQYMYDIDKHCANRYIWELRKLSVLKSWHDMSEDLFNDYLNQKI